MTAHPARIDISGPRLVVQALSLWLIPSAALIAAHEAIPEHSISLPDLPPADTAEDH